MKLKGLYSRKIIKSEHYLIRKFVIFFFCVLAVSLFCFFCYRFVNLKLRKENSLYNLRSKWHQYDYQSVYDISSAMLSEKPYDWYVRAYHGYASFYLAVSQGDVVLSQSYLDEAVNSLRIALLGAKPKIIPQIEYMLGKSYFYKNFQSSYYYYSDLAILYLQRAVSDGYESDDIPELLGLCYASLGMTMESISAFSEALLVRESDILLLSIAEQYYASAQYSLAQQYLYRISQNCRDEQIILKSHKLLGDMYLSEEKYEEAEVEFNAILEKNENSADAYYGLGVIYESQGDLVKARSEWRKALRIQNNHTGALKKLAEYK